MTIPTMSLSASSSYAPPFCPCHGPGSFFLFPVLVDAPVFADVVDTRLDWRVVGWDGVLGVESEGELAGCVERHERIFGIADGKYLALWEGGRDTAVGDGVGVKSGDDERDFPAKTLESSGEDLGPVSSS